MRSVHLGLGILTLSLAAVLLGGCKGVGGELSGVRTRRATETVGSGAVVPQAAKTSLPKNRYFEFEAKKGKTATQGSVVMPCDLWLPFRWEVTGGVFDLDRLGETDGAILGTELDGRGAWPPVIYYGISAEVSLGGLNAYAYTHNSSNSIGAHFFADATRLDFAIEADGALLLFLARRTGDSSWTTIATHPFPVQTTALNPSVGVFNMDSKGRVGFDDFQLIFNGLSQTPLSAQQEVARLIWEGSAGIISSLHGLDGGAPNFPTAEGALGTSYLGLEAALLANESVTDSKIRKKAKSYLEKARKKVAKAQSSVADANAKKALERLQSAFKYLLKAVSKLDPQQ
jgi:hypothetical protein